VNLIETLARLEGADDPHLARLLVLLRAFAGRGGTGPIEGLTKLAKLDFLLRYPPYLERALTAVGAPGERARVRDHERKSIESKMVRFRYGPWDHRYRRLINTLIARGLAYTEERGRTVIIGLTGAGVQLADRVSADEAFSDIASRARVLHRYFDRGGTNLMRFVYQTFPGIASLRLNQEID
jgi:hypothetical protein